MLKLIIFCFVIAAAILAVTSQVSNIGPGRWHVINVAVCPDDERYEHRFDIQRRRLNRTHDKYNACMNLSVPIDDSFGVRVDICQYVDGGCKPFQTLSDESFPRFANKFAEENVRDCLEKCGVENAAFPIPPGEWCFENFTFNYCELPGECVLGNFCAMGFLLRDTKEVACVKLEVEFKEADDENKCD